MFSNIVSLTIYDGHFNFHVGPGLWRRGERDNVFMVNSEISSHRLEFELLSNMTAPSAFYYEGHNSPKCHPNTRMVILERLQNWLVGNVEPNASILWLVGAAGSGKSCIAGSVAEWCQEQNLLLASFCFRRADSSRNTTYRFIPTLAYNITQTVADSRSYIESALGADPHVFTKTLEVQMLRLVLEPLVRLASLHPSQAAIRGLPYVFIIDGLDECLDRAEQKAIIHLFATILRRNIGWKVLITSRPGQTIQSSFDVLVPASLSSRIVLSNDHDSDGDIRRFLEDKLANIKHTHFRKWWIPPDWPFLSDIDHLVRKSSGRFTHAESIVRYISFDYGDPVDRLHAILDNGPVPCRIPEAQPSVKLDLSFMSVLIFSPF